MSFRSFRGFRPGWRPVATRLGLLAVVALVIPLASSGLGAAGTITTVAGKSPPQYAGDGGPATDAHMNEPRMMTFDAAGNMYIADTFNQAIRRVDTDGTITTVAGKRAGYVPRAETDCVPDFSGDGGSARDAALSCPHSVVVDSAGTMYIADSANHAIRRVDPTGVISTVAGQGGSPGDSGDGGPGTQAKIKGPKGVALDRQGDLLIADSGNGKIRRLDRSTGIITTMAGTGGAGSGGDGGPATAAQFEEPRTIAVGPDGSLLIADPPANRIRRVDPKGTISTFAGTGKAGFSGDGGPAARATLDAPRGVGVDGAGNVFIADSINQRIRMVATTGVITTVAGRGSRCFFSSRDRCGDGGPALEAGFATPRAVDVDGHGDLYVADTFNERIRRIEAAATPVRH